MTAVVILILLIALLWLIGDAVMLALLWGQQERSRTRVELLSRFAGFAPGLNAVSTPDERRDRVNGPSAAPERRASALEPVASQIPRQPVPTVPEVADTPKVETPKPPGELAFPAPVRRQPPVPPANQPVPPTDDPTSRPARRATNPRTANSANGVRPRRSQPALPSPAGLRSSDRQGAGLPPGSILPDFELLTIDGERFRRSLIGSKRTALLFLAPESPGSSAVLETIRSSQVRKRSLPDLLLVIDGGTPPESISRWLGRLPKRVTVLIQEDSELATVLNAPGTPAAYLLQNGSRTDGPLRTGARAVLEALGIAPSQMSSSARRSTDITPHAQVSTRLFSGLSVSASLPNLRYPLLGGGEWERSAEKPTLLILWDAGCPPCDALRDQLAEELPHWRGFETVVIARGLQSGARELEALRGIAPIVTQAGFDIALRLRQLEAPAAIAVSPAGEIMRPPAVGAAAVISLGRALRDQAAREPGALSEPSRG